MNSLFTHFIKYNRVPSNFFNNEIHLIREKKIDIVSSVMSEHPDLQLIKWVSVSSVTHMELDNWLKLDSFWQEAVFKSVQSYVKKQNETSKEEMNGFMKSLQKDATASSATINKPTFLMS